MEDCKVTEAKCDWQAACSGWHMRDTRARFMVKAKDLAAYAKCGWRLRGLACISDPQLWQGLLFGLLMLNMMCTHLGGGGLGGGPGGGGLGGGDGGSGGGGYGWRRIWTDPSKFPSLMLPTTNIPSAPYRLTDEPYKLCPL